MKCNIAYESLSGVKLSYFVHVHSNRIIHGVVSVGVCQGSDLDGKRNELLLVDCNYGHFSIMSE